MLGGKTLAHPKRYPMFLAAERIEEDRFGLVDLLHVARGFRVVMMLIGMVLFS